VPPRRPRRPLRLLVWLLVVLVVLTPVLVTADRAGHNRAEQIVADRIAAELAANQVEATPPEVTIAGTPFLTQVLAGRYERVTVNLRRAATDEVALTRIQLTATGVSAELDTLLSEEGAINADRLTGTAMMGYEAAMALIDLDNLELSDGGDGLLGIRLPRRILGEQVFLVGTAELEARPSGGAVRLHIQEMSVEEDVLLPFASDLADQYAQEYAEELTLTLRVPPLPFDLAVDSLTVEPAGVAIAVSATDASLAA
jgi:hypothetical protein